MRFFFIVVVLALVVGYIGFTVTNLGSVVSIKLWSSEYPDIPIWQVVIVSIGVGAALIGLLATVEGASIRFENRRLRKTMHKMERELNFLRTTQPSGGRAPEPDAIEESSRATLPVTAVTATLSEPASAPVYGERDDWPPENDNDDDDAYSGGRAV
ncbi:MAG: LapA family protein [Acidobacteria bacterium]|nr:LapA family protein [Acidobacteriota bacterium]